MRVVHVPYTYAPDPLGGTEVYVRALSRELTRQGVGCVIAAPGSECAAFTDDDGLPVRRFAIGEHRLACEGVPDVVAERNFTRVLDEFRPDIVHLHALTAAASERLFDAARRIGAATVFTYHTPTVSCLRGTMMQRGRAPCDGALDDKRCAACVLEHHGFAIFGLDQMLARFPVRAGKMLADAGIVGGPIRPLRLRQISSDGHTRFRSFLTKADRIVAVCDWVADVLRLNGFAEPTLVVNRQGLESIPETSARPSLHLADADRALRVGYFGRLDPNKGVETLIRAIRQARDAPITLDIHGIVQPGNEAFAMRLRRLAGEDNRIRFCAAVPPDAVVGMMARLDLVAVPSIGMETGPLVVLEAFAAGVPVIGSRLGGIAELVRDGVDGRLLPSGNVDRWARSIAALSLDRTPIARWREATMPPRTIREVATDMLGVYAEATAVQAGAT